MVCGHYCLIIILWLNQHKIREEPRIHLRHSEIVFVHMLIDVM